MGAEASGRASSAGSGHPVEVAAVEVGGFDVEVNLRLAPPELEAAVAALSDPAAAEETLHWGRNYLYTIGLDTAAGRLEVVVKQFRHQGFVARLRRRLSAGKATKSWHAARALVAAGIPTPEPVLVAESKAVEGASLFVTRRVPDVVESRYIFRSLAAGTHGDEFPTLDRAGFMRALGSLCRSLHEAGVWHRDFSIGNLLVRTADGAREPEIFIVDLNRARLGRRLGLVRRMRDLCRLPLVSSADRQDLLSGYWGEPVGRASVRYLLYGLSARLFRVRIWWKDAARRPFRAAARLVRGRRAYAHIPAARTGAAVRDKSVWDRLSDQPHQHASRWQRTRVRLADAGAHAEAAGAALVALPAAWRRYRELSRRRFETPFAWPGAGVALRPRPEDPEGLLAALGETGVRRVLLRLHPWEAGHAAELELARELASRGYELVFALPQIRELVKDQGRWRGAVEEIAECFRPFGRHFQIGQAINRSKWGIWTYREYLDLVATASEVLRREPGTLILGPAVIDFEFQATAAVLNMRRRDVHFDIVTSLLYVDRRGAPEGRQLGFDSARKATLLRAIAETARNSGPECWVTEVNWPLWEGPHSPAGRDVAVDEETQADYLVRYLLEVQASGMVKRVYWWQLVARGYGLVVAEGDGALRRRPAHRALAFLERRLGGGRFEARLAAPPGAWLLQFSTAAGEDVVVGWSASGRIGVELPGPARAVADRDGRVLPAPAGRILELGPSPIYAQVAER